MNIIRTGRKNSPIDRIEYAEGGRVTIKAFRGIYSSEHISVENHKNLVIGIPVTKSITSNLGATGVCCDDGFLNGEIIVN